jgi:carbamoyl-phosphate synthase small subunit
MPSLLTDPDGSEGRLILEDESSFAGRVFGSCRPATGEVVFNTGMVGYTEALTDPSYSGQILVLTYPLVGNYGVADSFESPKIQVAGLVVAELAGEYSHARARKSLPQWLCQEGIPCLVGVDTRALTKRLRERGCMLGKIVLQATNVQFEDPNRRNLVQAVSAGERKVYEGEGKTVVLVDCGAKVSIIDELRARGLRVIRVPWNYDFAKEDFDGVLISNGPGDPSGCQATVENIRRAMRTGRPMMGICLGHQLMALAAGATTYKLKFGHRGHNQPCVDVTTGRCIITAQNHGFAVDAATLPSGWTTWYRNANDGSNEGMRHVSHPFMSVQFHPEAAPGPVDARGLFDEFVGMM